MASGPGFDADSDVYPEIARANLHRMRGEYEEAAALSRSILKRYPNHPSAHTLLGDIAAEQGDLAGAIQWYELALDITPDSAADRHKLESVRRRLKEQDAARTAEQLGIPPRPGGARAAAAIILVALSTVAVAAFLLGRSTPQRSPRRVTVELPPVAATAPPMKAPPVNVPAVQAPQTPRETPPAPSVGARNTALVAQEDAAITQVLQQRSPSGDKILSAIQDPRTAALTLTYGANGADDERRLGAEFARTAFEQLPDVTVITVRGMRGGRLVFVADAYRRRLAETQGTGDGTGAAGEAWVSYVLSNEWPAARPAEGTGDRTARP